MKTREEILATWDTEGYYSDWFALDAYNPIDGTIKRVFVGSEDDVTDMWRGHYANPHDRAMGSFYRMSAISQSDARLFFENKVDELPDERGEYSMTEAAGILGVSRQRVHAMIKAGQLDAHKVGNAWNIYRYSVENRLANKPR